MKFDLLTYSNVEELKKFQEEKHAEGIEIYPFIFEVTQHYLTEEPGVIVDITSLTYYLEKFREYTVNALNNFIGADEESVLIIKADAVELAKEIFGPFFSSIKPIYSETPSPISIPTSDDLKQPFILRKELYTYSDSTEFEAIFNYANNNEYLLVPLSVIDDLKITNSEDLKLIIDVTSLIIILKESPQLISLLEGKFQKYKDAIFICKESSSDTIFQNFTLFFFKSISFTEYHSIPVSKEPHSKLIKITDIPSNEIPEFINKISKKLVGHKHFMSVLEKELRTFTFLNNIGEKPIYSIFLLGPTGIGKSQFAALLNSCLNPDSKLIKINFGNYSSQDALNNLIGSPRGFIGSNEGELSKKLLTVKSGIILCDEIEKADSKVLNFFLELLEDGKFTDTQSREFDLNGFIIIFTSNLLTKDFYKNIPSEFQSRLDLVSEFIPLNTQEKYKFAIDYCNDLCDRIDFSLSPEFKFLESPESFIDTLNLDSLDNVRDIKRQLLSHISKTAVTELEEQHV
jgi:hypothetical protein